MSNTATTTQHTPTPWKAVEHNWATIGIYAEDERCGGTVAVLDIQAEATEDTQAELETWMAANAELIVRAVNSHQPLIEALNDARELLNLVGVTSADTADYGNGRADDIIGRIDEALMLARVA